MSIKSWCAPSRFRAALRDSLMARLDRFMPVKEIAQIGAAIGREFSYELVAGGRPDAAGATGRRSDAAERSGLAFRRGTPPDAIYTFKHAARAGRGLSFGLLKSRRQELRRWHRAYDRGAVPEHQDHRTRGAGASRPPRRALLEAAIPLAGGEKSPSKRIRPLRRGRGPFRPEGLELVATLPPVIATRHQRTGAA